jgi:hypothetical protein
MLLLGLGLPASSLGFLEERRLAGLASLWRPTEPLLGCSECSCAGSLQVQRSSELSRSRLLLSSLTILQV